MTIWELLTLASVCLAGAASPGPSLAVVVGASLRGGRSAGLLASWAHACGVALYAAITVLGINALITQSPVIFSALQIGGALYLLYMAARLWRSTGTTPLSDEGDGPQSGSWVAARDGFTIAFLNPKLAVFMLALFSQFIRPEATLGTHWVLVAIAGLIDGLWYSFITLAVTAGPWIETLRRNGARIDRSFAALLTAVALFILVRSVLALP
jgi:threonine/homoserine/homoserine lactone efflux protein